MDRIFGIHEQALRIRASRAEMLSANLTNADTPGYKARDIDFRALLGGYQGGDGAVSLTRTHSAHTGESSLYAGAADALYRVPLQPALDGNTVDTQVEQSAFLQNALAYEASVGFLNGRIQSLLLAIKGE